VTLGPHVMRIETAAVAAVVVAEMVVAGMVGDGAPEGV